MSHQRRGMAENKRTQLSHTSPFRAGIGPHLRKKPRSHTGAIVPLIDSNAGLTLHHASRRRRRRRAQPLAGIRRRRSKEMPAPRHRPARPRHFRIRKQDQPFGKLVKFQRRQGRLPLLLPFRLRNPPTKLARMLSIKRFLDALDQTSLLGVFPKHLRPRHRLHHAQIAAAQMQSGHQTEQR